jgi:transcriptional antiterminator NusG
LPLNKEWVVLWTQSRCERLVTDQLRAAGFDAFLPTMRTWSRQRGTRKTIDVPMFPGYVFLAHAMDKRSYIDVVKTRGLVKILGESWDRLATVDPAEIETIKRIAASDVPVLAHAYLREGQQVRITHGPLAGVQGVLVRSDAARGLLVVSVELLQRSVAIEVDCTAVVGDGGPRCVVPPPPAYGAERMVAHL